MSNFLDHATIKSSVDRLGESRANSALVDYLIFKRALTLLGDTKGSIQTGTKSPHFVHAIDELTKVADPSENPEGPYFSPFGAKRDSGLGYRTKKYPSNGPSDTANRWQSRSDHPLELVPGTSPKEFKLKARNESELERFFLVASNKNTATKKPSIEDLAVWLNRAEDLSSFLTNGQLDSDSLIAETCKKLDLSRVERQALFCEETHLEPTLALFPECPDPESFLPVPPVHRRVSTASRLSAAARQTATEVGEVVSYITDKGYIFQPWQIAAFVTAIRTKPFTILAGISGTGKTKLPRLVAEATGAEFYKIPVKPDWTDSSELLGYERIGTGDTFVPGQLLRVAKLAISNPNTQYFALLDEMNVARVEYYLAEVLSHLEERSFQPDGSLVSEPLVPNASSAEWSSVRLPGNLSIVGSVNMDETTFGFSRKVLDRSFVIEFSTVSLSTIYAAGNPCKPEPWPAAKWLQNHISLAEHTERSSIDVERVIAALEAINEILSRLQMQVGYRVRDEIALFVLNAAECADSFVGEDESSINPLDLAISMKVLPRIQGTGTELGECIDQLIAWAAPQKTNDSTAGITIEAFPFCAERLRLMSRRLTESGYTSYWL